ncbi:MAG: toll/interleukin-1 receptor domain-containing protein [Deltaproteobacteria bacterium]|jgi:hypothetical protein|nr:toll/interleukin-1 receptor domain-containing protein [Deltaproteobacteria bacterium]
MLGEDLPNAGIICRDVVILNVMPHENGLRLRGLHSGRYRLDVYYDDVLYSQIDETKVGLRVALVEELSINEFFELRHNKGRNRMLSDNLDRHEFILDKLSRQECRIFAHYCDGPEMDERIVLASSLRVEEPDLKVARLKAETREYPHYAFISHEPGGADEKWAHWLERRLDNYRVQMEAVSEQRREEPVRKNKTGQADPIPERLSSLRENQGQSVTELARYLIVICSPRAALSSRVNEDARSFVEAGREDFIIPFIIEGEPDDMEGPKRCYPPSLFPDLMGISLADGTDEEAFFRLIARLLRVKFSRLYQGHLREQRRFMVRVLAAASGALVLLLVLAVWAVMAEITAVRRSWEAESLAHFLAEDFRYNERLPAEARQLIEEKIRNYEGVAAKTKPQPEN